MSDLNLCALISTIGAGLFLFGAVIGGLYIVSEDFADDGWGSRCIAIGGTVLALLMAFVWAYVGMAAWDYAFTFTTNLTARATVGFAPMLCGLYVRACLLRSETQTARS